MYGVERNAGISIKYTFVQKARPLLGLIAINFYFKRQHCYADSSYRLFAFLFIYVY